MTCKAQAFDDDDFSSTPIPFGRPQGFQFGQGTFTSSPVGSTSSTPIQNPDQSNSPVERSYSHARGDSFTSESSSYGHGKSAQSFSGRNTSLGHVATPSVATSVTSAPSRKSSFASIKSALKGLKTTASDAPPVPSLDTSAYPPLLRNPFGRAGSSRNASLPAPSNTSRRRPSAPSPSPSNAGASSRSVNIFAPQSIHSRAKSSMPVSASRALQSQPIDHSPSSSVAHSHSEIDSGGHTASHLPIISQRPFNQGPPRAAAQHPSYPEPSPEVEPRTPAEYALHAVFVQFVTISEQKIQSLLQETLVSTFEPPLVEKIGPGIDVSFDKVLDSLAHIAQRQAKPVIDALSRWKKGLSDQAIPPTCLQQHVSGLLDRNAQMDTKLRLIKRREVVATYIYCRTLINVVASLGKDSLDDEFANELEAIMFREFVRSHESAYVASANQKTNSNLFSVVLGHLANRSFMTVTDRYLHELQPLAMDHGQKDSDPRLEHVLTGLRYLELKVWPPEQFELGAEFMESLARCFKNAHGFKMKSVFAENLTHMLHPLGKNASAEFNIPSWVQAIEHIYPKAIGMTTNPKYWSTAFPLAVTALCVAPQDFFRKHWSALCDITITKLLKERFSRSMLKNGLVRVIWTYLYHCQDNASTVGTKMESIMRLLLPSKRRAVPEDMVDTLTYIVHFITSRPNLDYGPDLIMEMIQESALTNANMSPNDIVSPERITIAIRSGLLSLTSLEDKTYPSWPSNSDFYEAIPSTDYPFLTTSLPAPALSRPDIQSIVDRLGPVVARAVAVCFRALGHMSVLDPRYKYEHRSIPHEERGEIVVRHHPEGMVCCYPRSISPLLDVLQSCFDSWPRLLHHTLPFLDVLDMLTRCVEHVEPAIAGSATESISRLASESRYVRVVARAVSQSLFSASSLSRDSGSKLVSEHSRRIELWHTVVAKWHATSAEHGDEQALQQGPDIEDVNPVILLDEVEGGSLFLLASTSKWIRDTALKVLKMVPELRASTGGSATLTRERVCLIDVLGGKRSSIQVPVEGSLLIPDAEIERLNKWREANLPDYLLRLLVSDNSLDHSLWGSILPSLMKACMDHCPHALDICRESLNAAVLRYHPIMVSLAGMNSKAVNPPTHRHPNSSGRTNSSVHDFSAEQRNDIQQWRFWTAALCSCTLPTDVRPATAREHARMPSDPSNQGGRLSSSRGLFRLLIPFLACDSSLFRDSVVSALGSVHQSSFRTLLEGIHGINAHIYDDGFLSHVPRGTTRRTKNQDRLHIAVVRVYALTARFVREPQVSSDATAMNLLLNFVRATEGFLSQPDVKVDWEVSRLRRYFCHIVEQLFAVLPLEFDRSLDPILRLRLFRLCEDWCSYGSHPAYSQSTEMMKRHLMSTTRDIDDQRLAMDRFQKESATLAPSAAAAMSSLCVSEPKPSFLGAFFNGVSVWCSAPLTAAEIINWISALLASDKSVHQGGKKALKSLLIDKDVKPDLLDLAVRSSYSCSSSSASDAFFAVVSSMIIDSDGSPFGFLSDLWLGLVQLGRPTVDARRRALQVLLRITGDGNNNALLHELNAAVRSSAPNVYQSAQHKAASVLASIYPTACFGIISQATLRMPQSRENQQRPALQCLIPWVAITQLMASDREITTEGYGALQNLFSLTVRYGDSHSDILQALWSALVEGGHETNWSAVVKFLVEQATVRSNHSFVLYARKIIAYLSRTRIGPSVFTSLCTIIEPPSMILAQAPDPRPADSKDGFFVEDLDALLSKTTRQPLAPAELALLFLGDYALDGPWEHNAYLPSLLQISFTLLDHRVPTVRIQTRRLLFQILRSWVNPSNELLEPSGSLAVPDVMATIDSLEDEMDSSWNPTRRNEDGLNERIQRLCHSVLQLLTPIIPTIKGEWTETALQWGVQCPQRDAACRSLQIFRTLCSSSQPSMAIDLIDRLSNTISDPSGADSKFANEILLTLVDTCLSCSPSKSMFPQLFWCASAALLTTVEGEFLLAIRLMDSIFDSSDLRNPDEVELIRSNKPPTWESRELCIERLVFAGLRSSETALPSYRLLARALTVEGFDVVEAADNRLRLAYVAILPWCLHCIEANSPDETLVAMAEELAKIATEENRPDIHRILSSVSKNSFKRKEDFVRQAMSSIRENYWASYASEIVTILLGCILNEQSWLRSKSIQILKVLLQSADSRNPFSLSGSEQLMPLLRLLDTDMASQAMEVLDTPMVISGGPSARQVLRMSLHGLPPTEKTTDTVTFGTPSESGWSIAQPEEQSMKCRRNVAALMTTFNNVAEPRHLSGTTSTISFAESEDQPMRPPAPQFAAEDQSSSDAVSLSELVSQLHDLNAFFKSDQSSFTHQRVPPRFDAEDAERRVAAILSRSLARTPNNGPEDVSRGSNTSQHDSQFGGSIPPTPFVDLFGGSPFHSAEALHQNFMSMADDFEEADGDHDDHYAGQHSYKTTTAASGTTTPNRRDHQVHHTHSHSHGDFESPLHQSTPKSGGAAQHPHSLKDDSDSEYEFSAFAMDDSVVSRGRGGNNGPWSQQMPGGSQDAIELPHAGGETPAARRIGIRGRMMDTISPQRVNNDIHHRGARRRV
ncbi:cell morphogenesis N-terminal-domain-containing protein [Cantharellus anzutake]|uniref:cell morphogenesis N-terminal-domain-containing protein n=1 Tax=Cantharellus anzutake TaxID=1750568 RepID=UPI001902E3FD|nr:cell morphogenesis N-terminal-domain-containing protein [Cantharellus anzutake]KAF8324255.1 cell morphogenesis N-terminal-domain-containing protein [Cantharellus anzutake]